MLCLVSSIQWVLPTQLLASPNQQICFSDISTAKKVLKALKTGEVNAQDIVLCNQQVNTLKDQKLLLIQERDSLRQDKTELEGVATEYKDKYTSTAQRLNECEDEKPSRLTWYGAGFITALIVGLAGLFLAK